MAVKAFTGGETGSPKEVVETPLAAYSPSANGFARTGQFAFRASTVGISGRNYFSFSGYASELHDSDADLNETQLYARAYVTVETMPIPNTLDYAQLMIFSSSGILLADIKLSISLNEEGQIVVRDFGQTNIIGTSENALVPFRFYRIEAFCGAGSPAAWEVRVDGDTWLSGTSTLGSDPIRHMWFGMLNTGSTVQAAYVFDDILLDDANWPGPGRVYALRPIRAGTYSEWTDNLDFSDVRKSVLTDFSTYLQNTASGANQRLTFEIDKPDDVGVTGKIVGVTFVGYVTATGGSLDVQMMIRSGSSDYAFVPSVSDTIVDASRIGFFAEVDPTDSQPWTREKLENLEIGVKHISGTGDLALASLYALVATEVLE